VSGIPQLTGLGDLLVGTSGSLSLAEAAPSSPALMLVSTTISPAPFKGGSLLPVPVLLTLVVPSDSMGGSLMPRTYWPSGLSGVSLSFQSAILEIAAVKGVALSNALCADVP